VFYSNSPIFITLPYSVSNKLPCVQPVFTRRTSGHCLGTFRPVTFSVPSPVINIVSSTTSFSSSSCLSSLLHLFFSLWKVSAFHSLSLALSQDQCFLRWACRVALSVLWQIVMFYVITYVYIGLERGSEVGPGKSSRVMAHLFVKIRFCYPVARRYSAVKLGDKSVESAAFITRK